MQYVRAEPYRQNSEMELCNEGVRSAIDSFKLLGLLLEPARRRKLQLLLKFMKRVSGNDQLTLQKDCSNFMLVLDTFVTAILRKFAVTVLNIFFLYYFYMLKNELCI
jgi:hypothetical protein